MSTRETLIADALEDALMEDAMEDEATSCVTTRETLTHLPTADEERLAWAAFCAHSGPAPDADNIWPYEGAKAQWIRVIRSLRGTFDLAPGAGTLDAAIRTAYEERAGLLEATLLGKLDDGGRRRRAWLETRIDALELAEAHLRGSSFTLFDLTGVLDASPEVPSLAPVAGTPTRDEVETTLQDALARTKALREAAVEGEKRAHEVMNVRLDSSGHEAELKRLRDMVASAYGAACDECRGVVEAAIDSARGAR